MKKIIIALILLVSVCVTGLAGCHTGGSEGNETEAYTESAGHIEPVATTETPATTEAVEISDPDAYQPPNEYTEHGFASEWLNLHFIPNNIQGAQCDIELDRAYNIATDNKSTFEMRYNNGGVDNPPSIYCKIITKLLEDTTFEEEIRSTKRYYNKTVAGEQDGTRIEVTWEPDRNVGFLGETYRLITCKVVTYEDISSWSYDGSWRLTQSETVWHLFREKGGRLIDIYIEVFGSRPYFDLEEVLYNFETYDRTERFFEFDWEEVID